MSDALISGVVTITIYVLGFFSLMMKLRHAATLAKVAATKAGVVEQKLDANTATTESVDDKATTIVRQTNGAMDKIRELVVSIDERVSKLEDYNRTSTHRVLDVVNAMHLKIAAIGAVIAKEPPPASGGSK